MASLAGSKADISDQRRGKKRESLSELDGQPSMKKGSDEAVAKSDQSLLSDMVGLGLGSSADLMDYHDPMTAGELFLASHLADMDVKDCKQMIHIKKSVRNDNRPFFDGKLMVKLNSQADILVLVDSGASASFIDAEFVMLNDIRTYSLDHGLLCNSFDGSPASSGDITLFVKGDVLIPTISDSFLRSHVKLFVTKLASARDCLSVLFAGTWYLLGGTPCTCPAPPRRCWFL